MTSSITNPDFHELWKSAATCKRYRRADGSAVFTWINQEGKHSPFSCRSWRCDDCRPGISRFLQYRVGNWAEKYDLSRFWSFTLARGANGYLTPEKIQKYVILGYSDQAKVDKVYKDMLAMTRGDSAFAFEVSGDLAADLRTARAERIIKETRRRVTRRQLLHPTVHLYRRLANRYLSSVWNKWRTAAMRKFGKFSYIRLSEHHQDGIHPHIHCMVSSYIPWEYVRRTWDSYGGGEQVYVRYCGDADGNDKIRRVSAYVAKYVSKAAETPGEWWPANTRHITTSRDIKLKLTPAQYETISNTEEEEGISCPYGYSTVQLASEGFSTCYTCIFRKHCGIVLPYKWELYRGRHPVLSISPEQIISTEYHRQDLERIRRGKRPAELWKGCV